MLASQAASFGTTHGAIIGGAVYVLLYNGPTFSITNCTFQNNSATGRGGDVWLCGSMGISDSKMTHFRTTVLLTIWVPMASF